MAEASIPVDLFNPGQVFACLGFLEASDALIGNAVGGFDWSDQSNVRFRMRAAGDESPVASVLGFLADVRIGRLGPLGYSDPPPKKKTKGKSEGTEQCEDAECADTAEATLELSPTFYAPEGDRMSLPVRLEAGDRPTIQLGHWADGSSRESFKLYSGNRSAFSIVTAMLHGTDKTTGIIQLWTEKRDDLVRDPFNLLAPMGGSFNFDPRGAWTAIDAGYSPDQQDQHIEASPVVELLAAWGLENARPDEFETRKVRYAAWGDSLDLTLARAALCGALTTVPLRRFRFELALSGKNKVVTFAQLEDRS